MLEVKNLTKYFGDVRAVADVSFTIQDGEILGLIGQNGAGKTTTFRLILDFMKSDQGEILWNGQKLTEKDYNVIGYLPEERGLYPKISIEDQLIYFAKLRGKTKQEIAPKIDYWMDKFQVKGNKKDKVRTLSKGNQQKIQLISTLIHEPKLIILDEPFSGLDPVNAELLKDGILELRGQGSCVIFSSHNMDNVEKICDHLIMLRDGEMVLSGEVHKIREQFGRTQLQIESDLPLEAILATPGVLSAVAQENGLIAAQLSDASVGEVIFKEAVAFGYMPVFSQLPPTLEEIFKLKVGEGRE